VWYNGRRWAKEPTTTQNRIPLLLIFCYSGLRNHKEASDLTEAVKQTLYEDYLQTYSESNR
jgi:hypothetical protein